MDYFRKEKAKRMDTKEWIYGFPVALGDEEEYRWGLITNNLPIDKSTLSDIEVIEVIPETMCGYVGRFSSIFGDDDEFYDVWEHDIYTIHTNEGEFIAEITEGFGGYEFFIQDPEDDSKGWCWPFSDESITIDWELLGNSIDNPELLLDSRIRMKKLKELRYKKD